jgi:nucleoside-diphosphate-sugar epimerase
LDTETLNESLVIFGCGYIGLALAKECVGLGWSVTALTRNPESARNAEEIGAHTVLGNLQDDHWWPKIPKGVHHVVNCVGASSPTVEGYQESYLQGMQSIIQWIKQRGNPVRSLVFTSSSSVYPQTDGSVVDEESDTSGASARGQILLSAERLCLEASGPVAACKGVIRFSGLYGPGRHLLVDKIERGEPMTGSADRILNLLHRDDAVSSILALLQRASAVTGGIFNASDGQHATRGEIARWVAQRLKVPEPVFTGVGDTRGGHRRVDSTKISQVLGWKPKFPDFQSGYEDFLASKIG